MEQLSAKKIRASDALAAAMSHGDGADGMPSKRRDAAEPAGGVSLKPGADAYDVDAPKPSEPQQLQVAPITVLKSEYREQVTHQIVANASYICYGLKQGHIRVLNKVTANRALLKGHASMVVDMRFFSTTSNLLASLDQSGMLFVRKIYEGEADAGIQEEVLVSHKLDVSEAATRRLSWHPDLDNLLAVAAKDRVALINVPPTSGLAPSPDFAQPILPDKPSLEAGKAFTSIAFSHQGYLLAAGTSGGTVKVWAMPPDLASKQPYEPLPPTPSLSLVVFSGELLASNGACTADFLPSHAHRSVMVVANAVASRLELWVVAHPPGGTVTAECTYKLELQSSAQGPATFFNHLLVQPNFSVVVLANTKRKQVYVLHAHQDADSSRASFDYLCMFEVMLPILSMSTLTEPGYEAGSPVQEFHLYCVQTEAIQQYTLHPSACFPTADLEEEATRQGELEAESARAASASAPPHQDPFVPPTVHTSTTIPSPPPTPACMAPEEAERAAQAAAAAAAAEAAAWVEQAAAAEAQKAGSKGASRDEGAAAVGAASASASAAAAAAASASAGVSGETAAAAGAQAGVAAGSVAADGVAAVREEEEEVVRERGGKEKGGEGKADGAPAEAAAPLQQQQQQPQAQPARAQGRTTEEMLAEVLAKQRSKQAEEAAASKGAELEEESDEDLRRAQEAGNQARAREQQQQQQARQREEQEKQQQEQRSKEQQQQQQQQQKAAEEAEVCPSSTVRQGARREPASKVTAVEEGADGWMRVHARSPKKSPLLGKSPSAAKRPRIEDSEDDTAASMQPRAAQPRVSSGSNEDSASSSGSCGAQPVQGASPSTTAAPPLPKALLSRKGRSAGQPPQPPRAAAPNQQAGATAAPPPPPPAAPAPSSERSDAKVYAAADVDRLLAQQQQMLSQLMQTHKESMKAMLAEHKTEMKLQAKAHEAAVKSALESALKASEQREKESARVLGIVGKELGSKVEATVRQLPGQVAASIRSALAEALPVVTQQAVDKALTTQLRAVLPKTVSDAVRENFAAGVVPAFEKATQVIFAQMESAIKQSVAVHASPATKATAMLEQAHTQMGGLISTLRTEATSMRNETAALRNEGTAAGRSATAAAAAAAKAAAAATAASKAASQPAIQAPPPAPGPLAIQAPDPKTIINDQWARRQYDEAFGTALESGGDVLDWLLHKAPPESILDSEPCVLSPGVLLSLLTHLAHGVRNEPELKLRWIIEVATCLDPRHPQAAPHTKMVLEPVKLQLQMLARESPGELGRSAKTAVHLMNSLLHQ